MSMYNMLFGKNPKSKVILKTLNLTEADCGRFRDCYIKDDKIVVYTRNGGGNRQNCWEEDGVDYEKTLEGDCTCPACTINIVLPKHPNYIYDENDDFDSTYASIYFSFPKEYKEDLKQLGDPRTMAPSEKWKKLLNELDK